MKKYGYVIEMRKKSSHGSGFYSGTIPYNQSLRFAAVFNRDMARYLRTPYLETVRKVELFKSGKPKKVVK